MKYARIVVLGVMWIMSGCVGASVKPGREVACSNNRNPVWMSNRYSASAEANYYLNFYSHYEKYPGYGIVQYICDVREIENVTELELLRDSARIVKLQYMTGFNNDGILKWDANISKCVRFNIKYITIILDDVKRGIICCVILDAGDLFSKVDYGIREENIIY